MRTEQKTQSSVKKDPSSAAVIVENLLEGEYNPPVKFRVRRPVETLVGMFHVISVN